MVRWEEIYKVYENEGVNMIYPIHHIYRQMIDTLQRKQETIRKLIDLDKEVVRQLKIQAAEQDYRSVKAYIEDLLTKHALPSDN